MIKFYVSEFGIEYGGYFLFGTRFTSASDEAEARSLQEWFNNGAEFDDLADWAIHQLTPLQYETFLAEKTLYEL